MPPRSLSVCLQVVNKVPAYHHGHLKCVIGIVGATRAFQTAHLPILPFTTILYMLQKSNRMFPGYFHLHAAGLLRDGMGLSKGNGIFPLFPCFFEGRDITGHL